MPRTIYQIYDKDVAVFSGLKTPVGWSYIGETATSNATDQTPPVVWTKVPIYNRANNAWVQLNEDPSDAVVDYTLKDIDWDSADIDILDWDRFTAIHVLLYNMKTGSPVLVSDTVPTTAKYQIGPLIDNNPYRVNVIGQRMYGDGVSDDSITNFTTLINPKPKTPTNLRVTNHTNSSCSLAWDSPANSTAVSYRVYRLNEWDQQQGSYYPSSGATKSLTISGLPEDSKSKYYVVGVNSSGALSDPSNVVRWATGHETAYRSGSLNREPVWPAAWGAWNGINGWVPVGGSRSTLTGDVDVLDKIRQGYWQKDPQTTGTTNRVVPSEANGRYWGCVTYHIADFVNRVGGDVAGALNVTECRIKRIYRYRWHGAHTPPETQAYSWLVWHLTNTSPGNGSSGQPPIYDNHRNNSNSPDSGAGYDTINSGYYHDNLILPRRFGKAMTTGWLGGTQVNGICIYRYENMNSGSGTDGYMALAGHGKREFLASWFKDAPWSRTEGYSDWTLLISGTYTVVSRSYQAPYAW